MSNINIDSESVGVAISSGRPPVMLKTGLASCKLIAVNPTLEELIELKGERYSSNVDTTYPKYERYQEAVQPLVFWLQPEDEQVPALSYTIYLGLNEDINTNNNRKTYVNALGKSWNALSAEDLPTWFVSTRDGSPISYEVSTTGIDDLAHFLNLFLAYSSTADVAYMDMLAENKVTPKAIFEEGDLSGLRSVVDFIKNHEADTVSNATFLLGLYENSGYWNQTIMVDKHSSSSNPFPSKVMMDKLVDKLEEKAEAGYPLYREFLFAKSPELVVFDKESVDSELYYYATKEDGIRTDFSTFFDEKEPVKSDEPNMELEDVDDSIDEDLPF